MSGLRVSRRGPRRALTGLTLRADPRAWEAAGFTVDGGEVRIGSVGVQLDPGADRAIAAWSLDAALDGEPEQLDGLGAPSIGPAPPGPTEHPNTAIAIDHVVVFSSELERTIAAFGEAGIECRRIREVGPPDQQLRQAFFRLGEVICEVVQVPAEQAGPGGAARFWGLTVTVSDIGFAAELLGDRLGSVRDAVQPGRRIGTVRRDAGLGLPVALISPEPDRD